MEIREHSISGRTFLHQLQNRLFDLSKRNRNIYFNSGRGFVEIEAPDLSASKIVLDHADDEELFNQLDRLRIKAARNKRELGFHQLKLVTTFVHWTNTKVDPPERIISPLILRQAELIKERGIRDRFVLALSEDTEINPFVLRIWNELFGYTGLAAETFNGEGESIVKWLSGQDPNLEFGAVSDESTWTIERRNILGNFDFRKMSIIQDFDRILEDEGLTDALTNSGRSSNVRDISLTEWYNVLSSDPSQKNAVAEILSGKNLVLQGPPGTGKSQTIVNTIANLVERGKSVLVVSDKKVALDIVKHRLAGEGLGDFVLSLHDSRNDRKAFIKDLKKGYQQLLNYTVDQEAKNYERKKVLLEVDNLRRSIKRYFEELNETDDHNISLQHLYNRGLDFPLIREELSFDLKMKLPDYKDMQEVESDLNALAETLLKIGYSTRFSEHPLARLKSNVLCDKEGLKQLDQSLELLKGIENLNVCLQELKVTGDLGYLMILFIQVSCYNKLVEHDLIYLLNQDDKRTREYNKLIKKRENLKESLKRREESGKGWKIRFPKQDVQRALDIVNAKTSVFSRFFSVSYRKVVRQIKSAYSFADHLIEPSVQEVLSDLLAEHAVRDELLETESRFVSEFGIEEIDNVHLLVRDVRLKAEGRASIRDFLLASNGEVLTRLTPLIKQFDTVYYESKKLFDEAQKCSLEQLSDYVRQCRGCLGEFHVISHHCSTIGRRRSVLEGLKTVDLTCDFFKAAVIKNEINNRIQLRHWLSETEISDIEKKLEMLTRAERRMMQVNSQFIKSRQAARFHYAIKLTESSVVKLNQEERHLRQIYLEGKRMLEREFGKTRRYRSLRELMDGGCEPLLQTFKPVWMMSPHSVAENLDLKDQFDVIIFDEASQVRLEEGVSCFLRAKSFVIVGDDMQLPPTNFFAKEDSGGDFGKSLLEHYSSVIGKVTLKWHYRSESAELIRMNNTFFYDDELIAVPSVDGDSDAIEVRFLAEGLYVNRKNIPEAMESVRLLKQYLLDGQKSIGVVAFSREQQEAVIQALSVAVKQDPVLAELVELAYDFERDGHYEGLFIKNLESVQGDERDVIIVTVCYGPDENGKFIQQFGPVSQFGGERRLNVLFSRARKKVHVISSILPSDITTDSIGPRFLSKYLDNAMKGAVRQGVQIHTGIWRALRSIYDVDIQTLNADLKIGISGKKLVFNLNENPDIVDYFGVFMSRGWKSVCYDSRSLYHSPEAIQMALE